MCANPAPKYCPSDHPFVANDGKSCCSDFNKKLDLDTDPKCDGNVLSFSDPGICCFDSVPCTDQVNGCQNSENARSKPKVQVPCNLDVLIKPLLLQLFVQPIQTFVGLVIWRSDGTMKLWCTFMKLKSIAQMLITVPYPRWNRHLISNIFSILSVSETVWIRSTLIVSMLFLFQQLHHSVALQYRSIYVFLQEQDAFLSMLDFLRESHAVETPATAFQVMSLGQMDCHLKKFCQTKSIFGHTLMFWPLTFPHWKMTFNIGEFKRGKSLKWIVNSLAVWVSIEI